MTVGLRFEGPLAIVTLDRQAALNALDAATLRELSSAFDQVNESAARVLLLVGAGDKAFCAGADLTEVRGRDMKGHRAAMRFGQTTMAKLDDLRMPSIAVLHGYALGGGLELAMACTFRVATPKAKLGLPEIKLGLIPGYGGTQRLPRLVGPARATEMIVTGRTIDAAEAERIGLVNIVVEGTDPVALGAEFAKRFTGYGLVATQLARQAVQRATTGSLEEGLRTEADLTTIAFGTADAVEGMNAFLEKRAPVFKDA